MILRGLATLISVALSLCAFAIQANDVFLYGVDEARFRWPEPNEPFVDAYAVYVSRNGEAETLEQIVDAPEARIQADPGDRIVTRVRTVGRKTAGGPVAMSGFSPPSPGIRFFAPGTWSTPSTLVLHCGTCAEIQWRPLADPVTAFTQPRLQAPWRLAAVGSLSGPSVHEIWQNDVTGTIQVLRAGDPKGDVVARAFGPQMVRYEALTLAELDGDPALELLVRDVLTGAIQFWELRDGSFVAVGGAFIPTTWQLAGTTDHDGDGRSDLWFQTEAPGSIEVWQTNGFAFTELLLHADTGADGDAVAVADFDGDGRAEPLWRTSDGGLSISYLSADLDGRRADVERLISLVPAPGDDQLEVRAVVPFDTYPGAEILVQSRTTSRVSAILPRLWTVPARIPLFDLTERFELVLGR